MTANIHPQNLPYYHAVLDNLRAGREHGLQEWDYRHDDSWSDCESYDNGMPILSYDGWDSPQRLQMKPEAPAREMIKIGALELPKPYEPEMYENVELGFEYWVVKITNDGVPAKMKNDRSDFDKSMFESHLAYKTEDDAKVWGRFINALVTCGHETIAAITQQAKVNELEEKLQQITEAYTEQLEMREIARLIRDKLTNLSPEICMLITELESISLEQLRLRQVAPITRSEEYVSLVDKYDAAADKIVSLQAKINELEQQRKIDRKQLTDVVYTAITKARRSDTIAALEVADAVIAHLNAKPVTQEPKELVMPDWFKSPAGIGMYYEASTDGMRDLVHENSDLFRERGIVMPEELK